MMIRNKLKETKGAISIFAVLILVFLLPFAIWIGIEFPKMHEANERVKDAVDSAAASAVTLLDEDAFIEGEVWFKNDMREAEISASQIMANKLGLDYDLSTGVFKPKEGSNINGTKSIKVIIQTIDDQQLMADGVPTEVTVHSGILKGDGSPSWSKKIKTPTVVVETELTYKKIGWFGKDMTVHHVGMSQVNLNRE